MNERKRGFTLVEMLVVVGIIALLMSLVVMLIKGAIESAKAAKSSATVHTLDGGCVTYKAGCGVFPPTTSSNPPGPHSGSTALHFHLGRSRMEPAQYTDSGPIMTKKGPVIEFKTDVLRNENAVAETSPCPIIDAWERDILYANPGTKNPKGVDISSKGGDDVDPSDDLTNWTKN